MAEKDLKRKFALWIRPSLLEEVDSLYQKDNCASRSEFMEKALQFYIGYLACSHAQDYLAQVIPSTVKGIMDETANRMGRLMFKMAVEQAVTENILAAVCSVDQQDLSRLRGQCIEEILTPSPRVLLGGLKNLHFAYAKPQNIALKIEERRKVFGKHQETY